MGRRRARVHVAQERDTQWPLDGNCRCRGILPLRLLEAVEKPEYLASFDPSKGFKPAQGDRTEVFLQLAGSLEYYGSPEPYMRHVKAECARIEAKYQERLGKQPKGLCKWLGGLPADADLILRADPRLQIHPTPGSAAVFTRGSLSHSRF